MDELISKQTAIDALEDAEDAFGYLTKDWRVVLEQLPSAQPEPCEDAVSREAVLDALRTCYDTETITYDNGDEYIHYGDAVGEVEQLPPVTPKQKWTPVTKRLPEVKQKVLVQYADENMATKRCNDAGHLQWFYANAVAWMPAPEPWEGDAE